MYSIKVKILFRCKLLLPLIAACTLLPANLHATDDTIYLGGQDDHNGKPMLDIQILPQGKWIVYRKVGDKYEKQFLQTDITHIFAIKKISLLTTNKLQKLFFNIVHCLPFVNNAN